MNMGYFSVYVSMHVHLSELTQLKNRNCEFLVCLTRLRKQTNHIRRSIVLMPSGSVSLSIKHTFDVSTPPGEYRIYKSLHEMLHLITINYDKLSRQKFVLRDP